ncbi:MAG: hypothetical protein A2189_03380 [Paenibacillus sp. RIFOXYA1_FULL_44_5]|nr:MAG: hypothetical protein A2189_03380 [Paenibacillus sp. RIFOXYA1_FULL_44_5]
MRTHVLFGLSLGGAHKMVLESHQINDHVVVMVDDLMWGPLGNVLSHHVQTERLNWWEQVLNDEDLADDIPFLREKYRIFNEWANSLTDNDSILLWVGDNSTDYTGLMCLLTYLPKSIPMSVVMASRSYYKRFGRFKPLNVGEISLEKIYPLLEDVELISPHEREEHIRNWTKILKENGSLRILKNRQIQTVSEDYFDEEILIHAKRLSREKLYTQSDGFVPTARLVGEVIGHQKQTNKDFLIEWRVRCLIQKGLLSYHGLLNNMRLYSIKPFT